MSRLHRLKKILPLLLGAVGLVLFFSMQQAVSLVKAALEPVSGLSQGDASIHAFSTLIGMASAVTFFLLIYIARAATLIRRRSITTETSLSPGGSGHSLQGWAIGFLIAILAVAGTIVHVDPRGYYETDAFEPRWLLARGIKTQAYSRLTQTPDVVVMGSSRAFTISPHYIQENLGYLAYNASIEGGVTDDFLLQARYMLGQNEHALPRVLLIELSPHSFRTGTVAAERSPLRLMPYMRPGTALLAIQTRAEGLLNLQQLSEALFVVRYYRVSGQPPRRQWVFEADGEGTISPPANFEVVLDRAIERIPPPRCQQLDENRVRDMEELVALAEEHHTSLIFYISPHHPRYYSIVMKDDQEYNKCNTAFLEYMHDLVQAHDHIFFLDYTLLESIHGLDTVEGFYDSQHLTVLNSNRLIDTAADTIHQAFEAAAQRRAAAQSSSP